ncbi:MAG: hypothetical protein WCW65_00060 [Candidatus Paceibacterota bacterium]
MDENNKQPNSGNNIKTVRTYLSDMADTVRSNEISVIKVALAEQNKHEREDLYRNIEGTPSKKIFWIIGGIILVAGAIYGTYFILGQKALKDIPEQIVKEESIISYDEISPIIVTSVNELTDKLNIAKKEVSSSEKFGIVKYFSLSKDVNGLKEKILLKDLFQGLGFNAPSSLVRSLSPSYMIGTYTENIPYLFMIFQTKDYEYSYAGMLEWEKSLASDMLSLFSLDTTQTKLQLNNRKWQDIIINNKDVRVLLNENDKQILYYLFTDKNNLVIADNEETIKEIISKLVLRNIKPL